MNQAGIKRGVQDTTVDQPDASWHSAAAMKQEKKRVNITCVLFYFTDRLESKCLKVVLISLCQRCDCTEAAVCNSVHTGL